MNQAADRITGYPPQAWYERPRLVRQLVHPDWLAYIDEQWRRLLDGEVDPTYEYQIIRGYDGLELPEYNDLINLMKRDAWVDIHLYNSLTLDYTSPVLDLLGVRYVLSEHDLSATPGLRKVLDGTVKIFENEEALERAFALNNQELREYLVETLAGGRTLRSTTLPVRDARDLLRAAHVIEAGTATRSGYRFRVSETGVRASNDYYEAMDEFTIELIDDEK